MTGFCVGPSETWVHSALSDKISREGIEEAMSHSRVVWIKEFLNCPAGFEPSTTPRGLGHDEYLEAPIGAGYRDLFDFNFVSVADKLKVAATVVVVELGTASVVLVVLDWGGKVVFEVTAEVPQSEISIVDNTKNRLRDSRFRTCQ
ncbi:hypothetical protein AXFE_06100 [Acidithrix ferrooxidans]|uniref:Uncharacterized protein n=2 Tax=Acidimicrobiaceae TaxID=84994 RepID=A0A0D8HL68_9ACTN|nr:hypothetical protein AXFE_06100 [Acidithrix ferrooxidans]